jgi:cathepsin D
MAVYAPVFSFKLANTGSSLFLGGSNDSLYTGPIEYHNVDSNSGTWELSGAKLLIGSSTAVSNFQTVIDR